MHIIMLFVKTTFTGFFFEVLRYTVNAKPGLPGTLVEVIKKLKSQKLETKNNLHVQIDKILWNH